MSRVNRVIAGIGVVIGLLCAIGCGSSEMKQSDSMESTLKQAQKDNPGAKPPPGKTGKIKADQSKMPVANNDANNSGN